MPARAKVQLLQLNGSREAKSLAVGFSNRVAVMILPSIVILIFIVLASFDGSGETGALSLAWALAMVPLRITARIMAERADLFMASSIDRDGSGGLHPERQAPYCSSVTCSNQSTGEPLSFS
jgi:hypothetical protein